MLDVDGTLLASPTPLGVSFAEYLNEHTSDSPEGYGFDPAAMQQIEALMTDEDLTYVDRVEGVIDAYRNGIAGCRHRTVSRLARDFLDEINDTLPSQAQEAVEDLHTNGYEVALVSLNPTTVLREFRNVIGPGIIDEDNVYGLDFEVDGGVFTGRLMNNRPGFLRKKLAVEEMLSSNETTRDDSTAAGDTRYDLPMLNEVDYPAMISPSQPLKTMMDQRDAYIPSYDDISEYVQHVTEKDLGKQVPGMMGR